MATTTKTPAVVFWIASVGMEISWIYAWAAFTMSAFAKWLYPLPVAVAVAVFIIASLVTTAVRGRGWRVFQIGLIHGVGLTFFAFHNVHALWYPSETFCTLTWVGNFLGREREPVAWITLAAIWGWTLIFGLPVSGTPAAQNLTPMSYLRSTDVFIKTQPVTIRS